MGWTIRAAIAVAALASSGAVIAGDRMYPWKAGVTTEAFEADQTRCVDAAKVAMKDPKLPNPYVNPVTNASLAGSMGSAIGSGFAKGLMQGKILKATYYGCLAQAGYSPRRFPDAEFKTFKKLAADDRKARLQAMVSAAEPMHPEMPLDEYD